MVDFEIGDKIKFKDSSLNKIEYPEYIGKEVIVIEVLNSSGVVVESKDWARIHKFSNDRFEYIPKDSDLLFGIEKGDCLFFSDGSKGSCEGFDVEKCLICSGSKYYRIKDGINPFAIRDAKYVTKFLSIKTIDM